ncbi:concanavalin A-like lectin/glucanase domain-containing protein [Elsinoe ampelina]|uniref:chitinase n=1 Tax=Elsinoe ampelina TaxID=302913 RepID=A0A6A6GPZ7_9PEZI|nr:concanavalin A-like lectin/glucanase domain-containing protein [Elsinoe ampelina]
MLSLAPSLRLATVALLFINTASSQTFSECNPTQGQTCQPNPALGRSATADFTGGASSDFTAVGNVGYSSEGATFTVAKSGDSPQLQSNWYFMFGRFEITMKAAHGTGIVSSAVLQSSDLDEIDWEWLGGRPSEVQSNYFGKGVATSSNRGAFHAVSATQTQFRTYTIDWTADQIVWQVDGQTVRVLKSTDANGQYPQTPMQVRFGAWAGGDSSNAPGTIEWAGGATNYGDGPFTMVVKSISVTDYSTGSAYRYGDTSGSWQSIEAVGGQVNSRGGSNTNVASPAITSTSSGGPQWRGTHRSQTTLDPSINTNYPGLPTGWTVTSSGKVVPPPSAAPTPSPSPSSSPSPAPSPQVSCAASPGVETVRGFDDRGTPTTFLVASGGARRYDDRGFLITAAPDVPGCASTGAAAAAAGGRGLVRAEASVASFSSSSSSSSSSPGATPTVVNGAGAMRVGSGGFVMGFAAVVLGVVWL